MCTVSWIRQPDGYVLFCNRDERHTRQRATGPRLSSLNGVSFAAPTDGDYGGSWIGVNEFALTLCLLNRYGDRQTIPDRSFTSRGLLLTGLLDSENCSAIRQRLIKLDLEQFQPFTLAAISIAEPVLLIHWTGCDCLVDDEAELQMPLVSSSLTEPQIGQSRRQLLQQMIAEAGGIDRDLLDRFHHSHLPVRGPASVCMHRDEAATVSLSVVSVGPNSIEFAYHPSSPCQAATNEVVAITTGVRVIWGNDIS